MSAIEEIQPGDRVTAPSWDGYVATVEKIVPTTDAIPETFAFFVEGGFWRVSQLRKVAE